MSNIIPSDGSRETQALERLRRDIERYIYVVEFTSGSVKVGQTGNPNKRIGQHSMAAQAHGHSASRTWVSGPHIEYVANEAALIAFCEERWSVAVGHETFEAADFASILEYAQGLPYGRIAEGELRARSAERASALAWAHAAFNGKAALAKLGVLAEKAELIAPLVNDQNRWAACDAIYELAREGVSLSPSPWSDEDPTAAERYLSARGADLALARENAAEFELNFRTLYLIEYRREPESFEDLARFCDAVTGPVQGELGGAA